MRSYEFPSALYALQALVDGGLDAFGPDSRGPVSRSAPGTVRIGGKEKFETVTTRTPAEERATSEPTKRSYVTLVDPAGHPFDLFTDADFTDFVARKLKQGWRLP